MNFATHQQHFKDLANLFQSIEEIKIEIFALQM